MILRQGFTYPAGLVCNLARQTIDHVVQASVGLITFSDAQFRSYQFTHSQLHACRYLLDGMKFQMHDSKM